MTPKLQRWLDHWNDLQITHARINRAIDVTERWGMALIWTMVFLVPMLVTVPGLVIAYRRLHLLKRHADSLQARALRWMAEAA